MGEGKGLARSARESADQSIFGELSAQEKDLLVELLQEARDGGIHDTLVVLHEEMANGARLVKDGVEMAFEPYGTEIYFDWVARKEGDKWPDSQLSAEYR